MYQEPNIFLKKYHSENEKNLTMSVHSPAKAAKLSLDGRSPSQIMKNINYSFEGLFNKIKKIKEENTPLQQLKNNDQITSLSFKKNKKMKKPKTNKLISSTTREKQQTKSPLIYKFDRQLLALPVMKASIQIKEEMLFEQKLSISEFEIGKTLGSGKFGDVCCCRHKETKTVYALKKIFKSTIKEYNMVNQFILQLRIHYMLDHPNIIKLYGHFDDEYHIFLLLEYAEGGILLNKLKSTEQYTSNILQQAISAVSYLHHQEITHRDIKPENIVVQFDSVIKLCDFGWSSFYHNSMKSTFCGTLQYLSPQMKDRDKYDNSVDVWSLGILTYEMLVGYSPYEKSIKQWNRSGRKKGFNWNIKYPSHVSSTCENFIGGLLKEKPDQRKTLKECLEHHFIRKWRCGLEDSPYYSEFRPYI